MHIKAQWSETSLLDEIKALAGKIESLGSPQDRQSKHTLSYLKQMVKAKRDKLATLRYNAEN
jgi:hypothetical protein